MSTRLTRTVPFAALTVALSIFAGHEVLGGFSTQGFSTQGFSTQGFSTQGFSTQGFSTQGFSTQGFSTQGFSTQGIRGIDRLRDLLQPFLFRGISRADAQFKAIDLQGLQSGSPISFLPIVNPMAGVRLQRGPTDTSPGSYIFVPGLPATAAALKGSLWNMVLADACTTNAQCGGSSACTDGACIHACSSSADCASPAVCLQGSCSDVEGGIPLYIADVEKDPHQNSSKYPVNDDVYLYTVYYRQPATGQWSALCPLDVYGQATAMAIPLDPKDWSSDASRAKFAFACTGSGVAAKCARNWGYKPWKTVTENVWTGRGFASTAIPLAPFYDACLIAARADYCQDDHSYTKNGTTVDLFDTLDGFTSINPTVGLPFEPYALGVMLHEEYQISALHVGSNPAQPHFVSESYTPDQLMSLPADEQTLVESLRRSGMESSRYADLDPGRSCAAAPFIDRCDPKEPYACYRAANMSAAPYGAFLAVNSPRHCSHDEDHEGEALDPLCDQCVNRVCQIDPTCCGDPGATYYPGSLVWDQKCSDIRRSVCKSSPDAGALWPLGQTAPAAGSRPVVFRRGAIGAFGGFRTDPGGTTYAEGWACDPDYPTSSIPVQISIGGELGAAGATLYTTTASEVLVSGGWNETVATECGDPSSPARHGFRFALPAGSQGKDVYAYGIDLDLPGAPFSLLRGGKKTVPDAAQAPLAPLAAIWTGWVEPAASGRYTFCTQNPSNPGQCLANGPVNPSGADLYRIWVNGLYVAGNWTDTDPSMPGAFTLSPPSGFPAQYLRAGVRYGVRVEYKRPSATSASQLQLRWSSPDVPALAAPAPVPASALYPMAQSVGSGLLGTYYKGIATGDGPHLVVDGNNTPAASAPPTAVDLLWTGKNAPAAGIAVSDSFAAVFEGQVVPPISGDYTFTADTDGVARIFVNGQLVTDAGRGPPATDSSTCSHDICRAGAAESRTCRQGNFCAATICNGTPTDPGDAYCCAVTWDENCARKVKDVCHLDCQPTAPLAVTLSAGAKVPIRVEYQHDVRTALTPVRGGHLRLLWSLPASLSDPIPTQFLFAGVADSDANPAHGVGMGVGLNAAYFSDATFQTEYLDRVEGPLAFSAGSSAAPPDASLASELVCTTCAATTPPGPPALVAAQNASASGGFVTVNVIGRGVADPAAFGAAKTTVTIVDQPDVDCGRAPPLSSSFDVPAGATATRGGQSEGGTFMVALLLAHCHHTLVARQMISNGAQSAASAPLVFLAADPASPAAPSVTVPAGGLVTGTGNLQVGGTAAPGATVTVSDGKDAPASFTAAADGIWGGAVAVSGGPGSYSLAITQIVNGVAGDPTTVSASVSLPRLTVAAPAEGLTLGPSDLLPVQGTGAAPSLPVQVSDGDGTYFAPRAAVTPSGDGSFSGKAPALDYGRHEIEVSQAAASSSGADPDPIVRTVLVPPPKVTVSSPAGSAKVQPSFTVTGSGLPRTGLPGTAVVYQGGTNIKLAEAQVAADGSFSVAVALPGAGSQTIDVAQAASSLSGGGLAEGPRITIPIVVFPPAPIITSPATGRTQEALTVAISGKANPGAAIAIQIDDGHCNPSTTSGCAPTTTAAADGSFSTTVSFTASGAHHLAATQTLAGATSSASPDVLIAVGDVTPPTIQVVDANGAAAAAEIAVVSPDDNGVAVDFAKNLVATDCDASTVCVSLSPTCDPVAGSTFELGSSTVSCWATDAAGNRGSTTFVVTVRSTTPPDVELSDLVVEAQTPEGAAVPYQVTATGHVADCADPGSGAIVPCTSWKAAYAGLGFAPEVVAIDPTDPSLAPDGKQHGAVYAAFGTYDNSNANGAIQLFRSTDGGATWTSLPSPGKAFRYLSQIAVVPAKSAGLKPTLYVVTDGFNAGAFASRDGGSTWTTILPGTHVSGPYGRDLFADPSDGNHMLAIATAAYGQIANQIVETRDGWATWEPLSTAGLPGSRILSLAIDPVNPDRLYASVDPASADVKRVKLYVKVGSAAWQPLDIPPYPSVVATSAYAALIVIVPVVGQTFPTVFAGPVASRDGGNTWVDAGYPSGYSMYSMTVDPNVPQRVWATTLGGYLLHSADGGQSFSVASTSSLVGYGGFVQDAADPDTLYAATGDFGVPRYNMGLWKTTNRGQSWKVVLAPGANLPGATIKDVGFDPVDPATAYVVTGQGLSKTTDGGASWRWSGAGITDPYMPWSASKVAVDGLSSNRVYTGGPAYATGNNGFWRSPDGGANWAVVPSSELIGVDPLSSDAPYVIGARNPNGGCARSYLTDFFPCVGPAQFALSRLRAGVPDQTLVAYQWNQTTTGFEFNFYVPTAQFLPDRRRTSLLTFTRYTTATTAFTQSAQLFLPGDQPAGQLQILPHDTGLPTRFVFADASAGTSYLFAGGDGVSAYPLGGGPVLYRAKVDRVLAQRDGHPEDAGWEQVNAPPATTTVQSGGTAPFTDFTRLFIDPATGGQVMYTIGVGNSTATNFDTLWESRNGGRTWRRDGAENLSQAWFSPVDGSLYATVMTTAVGTTFRPGSGLPANYPPLYWPGVLWKRTPATGTPPGARVVVGDLRPSCRRKAGDGASGITPGSTFPVGQTILTCSATDAFGNAATRDLSITVQDTTPPAVTVPPSVTATAPAAGTVAVTFTAKAADLVDGSLAPDCDHLSGSSFPIGGTEVTCSATDSHGNKGSATFTVFVQKSGSSPAVPTLTTPVDQTVEATSSAGTSVVYTVTGTDDNGAALTPRCTPGSDSTFALGSTEVDCSATGATLTVTGSFHVTVQDTTPPSITVPADVSLDPGSARSATLSYTATATDAVDGPIACLFRAGSTPSSGRPACWCSPASGSTVPAGTTNEVRCVAVDSHGNRAIKAFKVTVNGLPPKLVLTDLPQVEAQDSIGARVTYSPAPTATDAAGNPLPIDCFPPSGTYLPIDVDTKVWCNATDASNRESSGSFTVRVVDTTPPSVTVSAPAAVEATGPSGAAVVFAASAQDLVGGVVPASCILNPGTGASLPLAASPASPPNFPVGANMVTCSASDQRGNTGSKSFTVIVRDTTPPLLSLPAPITATADATGAAVVAFNPTAMDAVSGAVPVACRPASGTRFLASRSMAATTVVSCWARDGVGNQAQGTFTVTVNSPPDPAAASCLGTASAPVIVSSAQGTCGATVSVATVGTCSGGMAGLASCALDGAPTETLGTGDHAVEVVATGRDGSTATCTAYVRVVDGEKPTLTCPSQQLECTGNHGATATPAAKCSDNCSCSASCATAFYTVGTASGSCTATDAAGNSATCQPTIAVVDTLAPAVTPRPGPMQLQCNVDKWMDPGAAALDACVGDLSSTVTTAGTVDPARVGSYAVTYSAVDPSGNTGSGARTVNVVDTLPPTTMATAGPNGSPNRLITVNVASYTIKPAGGGTPISGSATCWSTAGLAITLKATDACSAVKQVVYGIAAVPTTVSCGTASFTVARTGPTTVTYSATDQLGNVEATNTLPVYVGRLLGIPFSCVPVRANLPAHASVSVQGMITLTDSKTGKQTSQSFSFTFSY